MRAAVCRGPIRPDELALEEIERPPLDGGGVLVRVHASSANPVDLFTISRVANLQRGRRPATVGTDFAGTVEKVANDVTRFAPGDAVFGGGRGAFAEYVAIDEGKAVARIPEGVSFADAAMLPVAGSTALQAVRDHGRVERGHRVLVNGASGGVGTFAVQIARSFGAEVTAVCSTRNVDVVRRLGADRVIDYAHEDFAAGPERFDVMIDVAGNRSWRTCRRMLVAGGAYVGVGAAGVQHRRAGSLRTLGHFLRVRLGATRGGVRVIALFVTDVNAEDLEVLGELVRSGQVRPVIDRTYDLAQAGEALAYVDAGHAKGKVAIRIAG